MQEHGGDIIGRTLAEHGVGHIFTLCGGHISPILTGAKAQGVKVVDVRDEVSAVFAADAIARMTGIPGVAAVTAGPGVTNTITAIKNAQMAQSPVLIFGGAAATILRGRGALQDVDQISVLEPITKWATRISTLRAVGPTVSRALQVTSEGVPGPVFVELPIDLLYPESIVRQWYMDETGVEKMKGMGARALELYLKTHLARQFHAPYVRVDLTPPQPSLPFGADDDDLLAKAARAVEGAERPVLVVGSQALVNKTGEEVEAIAEAIRTLGMPTFLGGMARGLLGRFSDLQFRHARSAALKKADVVIVAGFPFDFRLGYGRKINSEATLIAANLSGTDLKKNRRPEIPLQIHPGEFLHALSIATKPDLDRWAPWFADCRSREDVRDTEIEGRATTEGELVDPVHFFLRLEEQLTDDSILVVDGGDFVGTAAYILRPRRPLSWLDPGVFGTLGVGGGFALGAAAARPNAPIWIIYGDGSSAYSLAEFDTYVRHGYAPIAVIGTDASWAQIARDQVEILGDDVATTLRRTEYHKVAEGYGGVGLLLTDPADVDNKIAEAKAIASEGRPVCLNVHLAGSDFRKGSISV